MQHIGILAHSADGATLCFLEMIREAARRLGAHEHPEITLSILPMGPMLPRYERGDLSTVRDYLLRSADHLAAAACDFFVCPDNTAHLALELPATTLPLPGFHIADIVAQRARDDARTCVGVLGTRWTVEGPTYHSAFARHGVKMRTPSERDRAFVDQVIFRELCQGVVAEPSRAEFVRIIDELRRDGCDAVALSCTELPLLIAPDISTLPTLDSTRLLAREAVAAALENRTPAWRGGRLS